MPVRPVVAALIAILLTSFDAHAQTWSQWRGPQFNGAADATGLPATWTTTDNVVWKTTLPGASAATPVVGGGRIFITAMDGETGALLALGLDRTTGKVLWKHTHGEGAVARRRGFENTRAECSAVTDGTHAWFLFGNGILVAYDLDGTEIWKRNLVEEYGEFQIGWGYASSPLLIDGKLIVQCLRTGPSFLLAVDPMTGRNAWKHTRQDDAFAESVEAYTSPLPFVHEGTTSIIVLGADCLTAHDPANGKERRRWSGLNPNGRPNFRAVSNALVGPDGFIYVTTPQGNPLHALQVKGTTVEEKWTMRRATPDVTTPLLYRDRLYVLDGKRRRKLTCLDPRTGVEHWQGEIEGDAHIRSSPTAADGKIFIMDADGIVTVVAAGDTFKVLARNELGSYPSRANVAIEGGQLLIRTADTLYCVGEARPTLADDQDWPQFRGAQASGRMEGHALPLTWDVATGENVAWKTPVPGLAHSAPVIVGERIFLTTAVKDGEAELKVGLFGSIEPVEDEGEHEMRVLCFDRATGAPRWSRAAWTGVPKIKRHPKGSHAASTPAASADRVVAFFGTEGLYCYDHAGDLRWSKDFGVLDSGFFMVPTAQWGFASSPIIHDDLVLVQCDVQGDSFIAALNLSDGSEKWRTGRDEVPTWSTPTVVIRGERAQVVANGWKHIGGYDLHTGAELWKLVGGGDIPVPTPIVHDNLLFITSAHGRLAPIYAIAADAAGSIDDDANAARVWTKTRNGCYMQTPIVYGDRIYCCRDNGVLGVYAVATGDEIYRERLSPGMSGFTASAVAGDGKLYFTSEEGEVHVVLPGDTLEVAAINNLDETCMATPAISHGRIHFRTRGHLVAVAATKKKSGNWPSFRGRRAAGVAEGHALPERWSVPEDENIAWRTPIPGLAHSSPIVWGDRLFVTTAVKDGEADLRVGLYGAGEPVEDEGEHAYRVYGLDKHNGAVLWERTLHEGTPAIKRHPKATHANSTPATDGTHLVAFFGSEGLYCLDLDGNEKWRKNLGVLNAGAPDLPEYEWGFASSPILEDGAVYVQCDVNGNSFLACFDVADGTERWRVSRDEAATWCTPTLVEHEGTRVLVANGYRHIGGYDPASGAEIWKLVGGGDVPVPTPVANHGLVYLTSAHGPMAPVYAVRADARGAVTLADAGADGAPMAWGHRRRGNYLQTPLPYRDWLYCCHDTGVLTCYDALTGEQVYRERLGDGTTGYTGSGVAGDGKLYFPSEAGTVSVVLAGPVFGVIEENDLGETCLSSPAISDGVIYFRTRGHVVAVRGGRDP